jgi:hypothetical protein
MPTLVWLYLTALLYDRTSATCVALAEGLPTGSHDRLTRRLQANGSGPTLLDAALRPRVAWERGYRMIDATVMANPFATALEGLAWVFSSPERRPVSGLSLGLLVGTDGTLRVPLGVRLWRTGGASQDALALAWLSHARNHLRGHPEDVLCDAW